VEILLRNGANINEKDVRNIGVEGLGLRPSWFVRETEDIYRERRENG
jgi:hypothetical protein